MKNLYFKYVLMGLWLLCYFPFKKTLVLSSQAKEVSANTSSPESTWVESISAHFTPVSISPSPIQAAFPHDSYLSEYSDRSMNHLDISNLRIKDLKRASSFTGLSRSYLHTTYLLWLSGQKDQYFHQQVFSHF